MLRAPCLLAVLSIFSFYPLHSADKPKHHGKPLSATEIFKRAAPAIVEIDCFDEKGVKTSLATGFLVSSDGRIATNFHVIATCKAATVKFANGDIYDAPMVVDTDLRKDLALIRVKAVNTPQLALGDSDTLEIGETVYSIGNPSGLQNTLQQGLVNAFRQVTGYKLVQVSASINPGNSGGPILNDQGAVVAIASARIQGADNLGFAVPINYLKGYLGTRTEVPFGSFAAAMAPILAKAKAADPVGDWSGRLGNGSQGLQVVVHLRRNATGLEGTLDGPDQNSTGIRITAISLDQSKLTFRADSVHVQYAGVITAQGDKIEGTWDQGSPVALNLARLQPGQNATTLAPVRETVVQSPSSPIAVREDKLETFLRTKIGVWTAEDAKATLGKVVMERPFKWANAERDGVGVELQFLTPGTEFSRVGLRFSGTSFKLVNIAFLPPQSVTWVRQLEYMKQKFPGDNFTVGGRAEQPEYNFHGCRTIFAVKADGTVAWMFAY